MKEFSYSNPKNNKEWETSNSYILEDGTITNQKPESMTQLVGNKLVYKDDPRIIFRGKLDTFQAELICVIKRFKLLNASKELIEQLKELKQYSMLILGNEVLNKELETSDLLGWTEKEIRERSHHPHKYYGLKQMILIDEDFSEIVIELNYLRAKVREIELSAVQAFRNGDTIIRNDLILALNRMSSCFHILMYQEITR